MLWVALALVAGWAVTVAAGARMFDRARREHARREDLLVNQVCALAGRPWQSPPADEYVPPVLPAKDDDGWGAWVNDAEQVIQ